MSWLIISPAIAYLFSLTAATTYLPQVIAIVAIIFIVFSRNNLPAIYPISLIINLLIFCTGGVTSIFFFLNYFLLFVVALTNQPRVSLSFSIVTILLLSQSLNSGLSLIPILSLLFVTPIVWYISRQAQSNQSTQKTIIKDETDFLLWLNLKFKTGITTIIDLSSQLQSNSGLPYSQKQQLSKIKSSAKSLYNSSEKLTSEISSNSDEI